MSDRKVISKKLYNNSQTWTFSLVVKYENPFIHKLKVVIERNAYDFQSNMKGYVFDSNNLKWNRLVFKPIEGAHCENISYVTQKPNEKLFLDDANEIIKELQAIVI